MTALTEIELIPQPRLKEILGVSQMTLYRWRKKQDFPKARIIEGRLYFHADEIRDWVNSRPSGHGADPRRPA